MASDEMKKGDYLEQESEAHRPIWAKLGIECFVERIEDLRDESVDHWKSVRIYLTGKEYAGILATNSGEGWQPVYPHGTSYPIKGTFFVPNVTYETWYLAVLASLSPSAYLKGATKMEMSFAVRTAEKLQQYRKIDAEYVLSLMASDQPDIVMDLWMGTNAR